ncbi:VacJ family lipoprotein [Pacificimonas sp. WHA3]|uniref:VacJ family lipoprotein n=1 Tax=Pacificimonas pallii TaxID=2827236 RepID=A0ABS6SD80_9SPHN|nr:VacJ family lipoprotein [Pacificimonas pallii]MBV7256372.1 VacJ family lipoprotein [Pacificimonas pallii]
MQIRPHIKAFPVLALLGACATTPAAYQEGDSAEGFNRAIYSFNDAVDKAVIKPVAKGYRAVVPKPARTGITNALDNVDEPLSFMNALLQGKIKRAFRAVDRFAINSTYGVLGFADRAAELGLERQEEDFGQTLAVWGVPSGPYIMLPLLGPSSLRDAAGFGLDSVTDPWGRFQERTLNLSGTERLGVTGGEVIELRARLVETADPLIENAFDPYATIKSAYIQSRTAEIFDGNPPVAKDGFEEMEDFEPVEDFAKDE